MMKPALLGLWTILAMTVITPAELIRRDFDHDGTDERIVVRNGEALIESLDVESGEWSKADFQLPVSLAERRPTGAALKFLDLNGDGFDDVLLSDDNHFHIALWSTQVKPHLGWAKGWSQLVRKGARTGAAGEPPPLAGAELEIFEGELRITRNGELDSISLLRDLLAFDMPPPKSPDGSLECFS
ncbi:MAG: hypothetical protein ACR2RV_07010, partial [Verrucomicrobiales bacterium]